MSDVLEIEEPAIEEPIAFTDKRILSIKVDIQNGYLDIKTTDKNFDMLYNIEDENGRIDGESTLLQILAETPLDIKEGVLFIEHNEERIDIIELIKGKASIDGYYYNADDTEPETSEPVIDDSLLEFGIEDANVLDIKGIDIELEVTDAEKVEIADQQNRLIGEIEDLEIEAKRVASNLRIKIQALRGELAELHEEYGQNRVVRHFSSRYYLNQEKKVHQYFHLTKPEILKEEPIRASDYKTVNMFENLAENEENSTELEFPDIDTSEESTNEFLNEINSETESEPTVTDEEE